MARKKSSALTALADVKQERVALESRAAELKRAAALELGLVVLDAGGEELGPEALRGLVARAAAIGTDATLRQLAQADRRTAGTPGHEPGASPAGEVGNG